MKPPTCNHDHPCGISPRSIACHTKWTHSSLQVQPIVASMVNKTESFCWLSKYLKIWCVCVTY